jgi:hypothetical protein
MLSEVPLNTEVTKRDGGDVPFDILGGGGGGPCPHFWIKSVNYITKIEGSVTKNCP